MRLSLPDGIPAIYYHGINAFVHLTAIALMIVLAIVFLIKRNDVVRYTRRMRQADAGFMVGYSATKFLFLCAVCFPDFYDIFTEITYVTATAGIMMMIAIIEHYLIKKSRNVFTIISIGVLVVQSAGVIGIFPRLIARMFTNAAVPVMIALIIIMYFLLVFTTAGKIRRNALLDIVAIALIGIGTLLDGEDFVIGAGNIYVSNMNALDLYYAISPGLVIGGIILFASMSSIDDAIVDFYTNDHVCIVHKGKIEGKFFVCGTCKAFYCIKYKEAIQQIDKCCWNCKTPFDRATLAEVSKATPEETLTEIFSPGKVKAVGAGKEGEKAIK